MDYIKSLDGSVTKEDLLKQLEKNNNSNTNTNTNTNTNSNSNSNVNENSHIHQQAVQVFLIIVTCHKAAILMLVIQIMH